MVWSGADLEMSLMDGSVYLKQKLQLASRSDQIFQENEAITYLRVYLNYGYYLTLTPFKIHFNKTTGMFEIQTSIFQRIRRMLGAILVGFYFVMEVYHKYQDDSKGRLTQYFEVAGRFADTLFVLWILYCFGRKGEEINELFQMIQAAIDTKPGKQGFLASHRVQLTTHLFCLLVLAPSILYILQIFKDSSWGFQETFEFFQEDATRTLSYLFPNSLESGGWQVRLFAVLSLATNIIDRALNTFCDLMFFMTVLLFRQLVNSFRHSLRNPGQAGPGQVLDHYRSLKNITDKINRTMGLMTFSCVLGNLPFFATSVFDMFTETNNFARTLQLFVFLYFFSSLFWAAKISKDIEEVKTWLWKANNYNQIPHRELLVYLQEITTQPVALGYGLLLLTYTTVASLISIIFTYALLKLQFNNRLPCETPLANYFRATLTTPSEI